MIRVNRILENEKYKAYIERIMAAEENRLFCRHNMSHFLDVARIAMLLKQEEGIEIDRELIYAAALLHDIGRFAEYEDGTPHEKASAELAGVIMEECGFSAQEQQQITKAVYGHRRKETAQERTLSGILYRADKLSRPCFACRMEKECNWKTEKKNLRLYY